MQYIRSRRYGQQECSTSNSARAHNHALQSQDLLSFNLKKLPPIDANVQLQLSCVIVNFSNSSSNSNSNSKSNSNSNSNSNSKCTHLRR